MIGPKRVLPPAGAPLTASDILKGIQGAAEGRRSLERLAREIQGRFGVKRCRLVSSGRAALSVALIALGRLSPRREVIIPAYTSFSVPAAVVRAGFEITLCDIDPSTLDFNLAHLESLVDRNTLAVVPNHLFGFPSDLEGITSVAKTSGAFVVEDAAQAMGARYQGRPVGTIGDVGFYSLGRGKNITAVNGGIIVTGSDEIARALDQVPLAAVPARERWSDPFAAGALGLLLKPRWYWLPDGMPWLELGVSKFCPDFPLEKLTPFRAGLALAMLEKLDRLTVIRRAHAEQYLRCLEDVGDFGRIDSIPGSTPAYLRLPIILPSPASRSEFMRGLNARNLGVSTAYPACLGDVEGLQGHLTSRNGKLDGARAVAARILTLPTHPMVTSRDISMICEALSVHARGRAQAASVPRRAGVNAGRLGWG